MFAVNLTRFSSLFSRAFLGWRMLIDHGRIGRGIYFWTERVVFSCEESEMI